MCGRVMQYREAARYARMVGADPATGLPNAPPHYNGAPTQDFLVGRRHPKTGETSLDLLRFGLIPAWAKDRKVAARFINARSESVATTAAFRGAYEKGRRCLIPVDGFYEWKAIAAGAGKGARARTIKQPYAIGMADGDSFTLAGLWEVWRDPDTGEWVRSFTILTTAANPLVARLHDRMPVIVAPQDRERWLAGEDPGGLLVPFPAEAMRIWPVSQAVNTPRNDGPELLEEVPDPLPPTGEAAPGLPLEPVPRVDEGAPACRPANSE